MMLRERKNGRSRVAKRFSEGWLEADCLAMAVQIRKCSTRVLMVPVSSRHSLDRQDCS